MVTSSTPGPLVLRRQYDASPELVFSVWTSAEYMKQWFRPSKAFTHQFVEVDLRVGGKYRVAFEGPDGNVDVVGGEFLEVTPPRKLVFHMVCLGVCVLVHSIRTRRFSARDRVSQKGPKRLNSKCVLTSPRNFPLAIPWLVRSSCCVAGLTHA
ncbi:MAG: SRPBCC domain-containing protein [Planctomycetales bacterium]|nr:SRPBCC domain-containing protein [Planctomycetales bacterium]